MIALVILLAVGLLPLTPKPAIHALFTISKEDDFTPQVLAGATAAATPAVGGPVTTPLPNAGALTPTVVLACLGLGLTMLGAWRLKKQQI